MFGFYVTTIMLMISFAGFLLVLGLNSCPSQGGSDSLSIVQLFGVGGHSSLTESLILAQDERWRRA